MNHDKLVTVSLDGNKILWEKDIHYLIKSFFGIASGLREGIGCWIWHISC